MLKTILTLLAVLTLAIPASSEPAVSELKEFYNLVPDYSKTNGAYSPAISPNGDTLVFYAQDGKVQVLSGIKSFTQKLESKGYTEPQSWQLEVKIPDTKKAYLQLNDEPSRIGRHIDWSPDGKSFVFVYQGRLMLAEGIDIQKKTAKVKMLADLLTKDDLKDNGSYRNYKSSITSQEPISLPRWSPDGTKVAYLRPKVAFPGAICVVDVKSGKETLITDQATDCPLLWQQPWSPDSKYLAYTLVRSENFPGQDEAFMKIDGKGLYLAVVPADGSRASHTFSDSGRGSYSPSWNPKFNEIAYVAPSQDMIKFWESGNISAYPDTVFSLTAYSRKIEFKDNNLSSLVTQQISYKDPEIQKYLSAAKEAADKRQNEKFEELYHNVMTSEELQRLHDGTLSLSEMMAISIIAQVQAILPPEDEHIIADMRRAIDPTKKADEMLSDVFKVMDPYQDKLLSSNNGSFSFGFPWMEKRVIADTEPLYSPDGSKIALIRNAFNQADQLWILDPSTGKERLLISAYSIDCVSWTADGKRLLLQTKRKLAEKKKPGEVETTKWPSYPEVWLIEPK